MGCYGVSAQIFYCRKAPQVDPQDLDADEWCEGLTAAAPYCFQGSHAFEVGKADTHCKRENANGVDDDLGAGEKIFEFDDVDDDDEDKE